jgi:hypothetical protein
MANVKITDKGLARHAGELIYFNGEDAVLCFKEDRYFADSENGCFNIEGIVGLWKMTSGGYKTICFYDYFRNN